MDLIITSRAESHLYVYRHLDEQHKTYHYGNCWHASSGADGTFPPSSDLSQRGLECF